MKHAVYTLIMSMILSGCASLSHNDNYYRHRVFQIINPIMGTCSAVQAKAPSGKIYMVSARHCQSLIEPGGFITAIDENGKQKRVALVAVSDTADVILLGAMDDKAVSVARSAKTHDHIFTMTHGRGMPAYRTDGELLKVIYIEEFNISLMFSTAWVIPGSSGGPAFNMDGELIGIISVTDGGHLSGLVQLSDIQAILKGR